MKVLTIASALLIAFAGVATAAESTKAETYESLMAREAEASPRRRWWGFRWSPHGHGGWKREAGPAPAWVAQEDDMAGYKREAEAEASPRRRWWGFRWSPHGHGGWKRDLSDDEDDSQDGSDTIFLPYGMTPDDLVDMVKDAEAEKAADAAAAAKNTQE